ncbi:D-alanyl-D-alanine carboxypeptidase/D-alanyl-D-alanine endopeptidase [Allorhizocola rhizosphaerae]|uniref:D-alanyl-D-alanine carboxypeptidase/D-alanyl-D-alanine endopeptidase n=1 Tax=Allorhizocola rhizosphaerae TaxID=1872709 RepID=UPI000E3CAE04|nr:D-alanyl-D-alanine carboxypeptidase/D-alanyl-D-alanine-endopeptidase [Allorhizocola rhizosphaerae]
MADNILPARRSVLAALGAVPLAAALPKAAWAAPSFDARIREIIERPEFAGSQWGISIQGPDGPLYQLDADRQFQAASAMKVFIAGTAFHALGADRRFRTTIYGTGPVVKGVLRGDLVLVAGGDMLLGGRVRRDGTLRLPDPDHTYGAVPGAGPVGGDPLGTLRELACRLADRGIRRIDGRVVVDASLFREARESIANGNVMVTVSPMMVNDNVIDVVIEPGRRAGAPAVLRVTPETGYVRIRNEVTTVEGPAARPLVLAEDGALSGEIALGQSLFRAYYIPAPARFAAVAFSEVLRDNGIRVLSEEVEPGVRTPLTEHVSPPLPEQLKVMLKVSSNVHTAMWPHVVGAGHDNPKEAYHAFRRELFGRAGIEPDPPGATEGLYTPTLFTQFLMHLKREPYFAPFRQALPIMGRDGSLAKVQVGSPAAGHVHAKTGTAMMMGPQGMLHKALAGYIRQPNGRWLAFGTFMNQRVAPPALPMELASLAGEAMGEIATAAYLGLEAS